MNQDEKEDSTLYKAVVNHEEQYSICRRIVRIRWDGGTQARRV